TYTWVNDNSGTDNQDLSLTGNSLNLTNDGTPVDLSGYLDNTDAQNLTSTVTGGNATINISGGTGTTFSINDADADPTNEYNTGANLTGNNLNIIDGGGTQTVDLSGLKDHDWYEVGGTNQPDNINDNIYTQGNVGIGLAAPNAQLDVNGNILYSGNASTLFEVTSASDNIHLNMIKASTGLTNAQILFDGYGAPVDQGQIRFYTKRDVSNGGTGTLDHAMSIIDGGNVGINTTTPTEKLHIEGNQYMHDVNQSQIHLASENNTSNHSADIRMTNLTSGNGWIITEGQLNADDNFTIQSFDNSNTYSTRFYINHTNGNTGIGTNAPTSALDVNGNLRVRNIPAGAGTDEILVANATGDVRKLALKMTDTWQAIGTTSAGTTTKSWVDMPDMLLNINLIKQADVSISWDATLYTGGGGLPWGAYRILVDGTPVNWGHMQANASWDQTPNLSYIAQNLAAGNHVIKVQWAVGSAGGGDSINNAAASSTYLGGTNIWSRQLRAIAYYY
ncbi:MAG: hypothetical protein N4A35_11180, partial [Flavobacteriales bacterium]|nr:hypothetical protein [Flavobacteriales bacterium]